MPPTPPRLERRGRHASGITLAASALSAFALVAACAACAGPPRTSGPGGQSAYTLSAGTPAAKGELDSFSWALYAEPPTLDYLQAFDYPQNTILSNVCESLMRWTPQLGEQPGLAEKATNPDPTTWVFDLRPGVKFQDGGVMTADDVVFSLSRQMNPDNGGAWANVFQNVDTITRTGPLQVTVKLRTADSQFPQYMATAAGVVAGARGVQAAGKDYGTSGSLDCTGPYRLGTWIKGQSVELDRFDDYWGTRAKSKKVVFDFLTDPSARTNALLTGEADGGYLIPTESYARLKNSSAGTLYFGEGLSTVNVNVTNMRGPLGDVRVRKALSLAIDRSGFVSTGLGGSGTPTTSLTPRAAWAAADEATRQTALDGLQPTAPDIAQATQLIKDAGARGRTLTMATSSIGQDVSLLATAVQSAGTRIGLNIQLKTIAPDAFTALFTDPKAREGIDMFPETYYLSITDPMDLLTNFQAGSYQNYAGYSDSGYDDLVKQATGTYDPAQRLAIEAQLNRKAADQVLWIPVAEWPTSLFMNRRITGAPTTISYMYYPWAADVGAAR